MSEQATATTPAAIELKTEITEFFKSGGSAVIRERIKQQLIEQKTNEYVALVTEGLQLREEIQKNVYACKKADVVTKDLSGKITSESWSDKRIADYKKANEDLEKLDKVLESALTGNSFDKLKETIGALKNANKAKTAEA